VFRKLRDGDTSWNCFSFEENQRRNQSHLSRYLPTISSLTTFLERPLGQSVGSKVLVQTMVKLHDDDSVEYVKGHATGHNETLLGRAIFTFPSSYVSLFPFVHMLSLSSPFLPLSNKRMTARHRVVMKETAICSL
jgi:hypothetical protein